MTVNRWVSFLNIVLWSVNSALCVLSGKCSFSVHSTHFWCTVWKGLCFCAQYTFLMYRLESVLFLCTVHISDVPFGKCSISVHSTLFWSTVWKVFCFCAHYIFLITVWKVFFFCALYTFLMYLLESALFLCTVPISDVPPEKCCVCAQYTFLMYRLKSVVSVHCTHFWYTVWKVFCFLALYIFLMYCLEIVLFLCTVRISDAQICHNYVIDFSFWLCVARLASFLL